MININNLRIEFTENIPVIRNLSFAVNKGEIVGIVGESGSGKSITAYYMKGLLPSTAKVISGELTGDIENSEISMIYQEPMNALNPVMTIGKQIENAVKKHFSNDIKKHVIKCMEDAGLENCEKLYELYPHQLSGGMRQRVLIAMALACKPSLIIADEPTTALDASNRTRIVERFRKINAKFNTAILLISHDIEIISSICSRVLVMKDGEIVEENSIDEIMNNPKNPYTKELVAAAKAKNFSYIAKDSKGESSSAMGLVVKNINGYYRNREKVRVLHDISFEIKPGEIFGLVGESGSGKSTLAKTIAGLIKDSEGSILLDGMEINGLSARKRRKYTKNIQVVFQDPFGSLNPKMKVGRFVEEPLIIHKVCSSAEERKRKVLDIFSLVDLAPEIYDRYPHELSGGQRQRISISAALILKPGLVIADEPVSAVDLNIEAQILRLLRDLHRKFNITFLFISHDIKLVNNLCDRVAVMENGKIISVNVPDKPEENK